MLSVTMGCMFSGKTSTLIKRKVEGIHLVIDYDTTNSITSYPSELYSHDKQRIHCYKTKTLDIDISVADVISINEAQFFPDLIQFIKSALKQNKIIYVYGLDGDYKQEPFGSMLELIPLSDEYIKLYAICKCGKKAAFSKRLTSTKEQYAPHDEYQACCRDCLRV
jgi:thymidine kinase